MSIDPDPTPIDHQSQYTAFMGAVAVINAASFDMQNVQREPSDCEKVEMAIAALQQAYNEHCPIL